MNGHPEIDDPAPNGQDESPRIPPPLAEQAIAGETVHDTLGDQLRAIAQAAQAAPPGSPQRNQQLNRLISLAQQSGKLSRPRLRQLDPHPTLYQEIHEEARQRTWHWLCRSIEEYDPEQASVLTWINGYLKWRIRDVETEMINYDRCNRTQCQESEQGWFDLIDNIPAPDLHDPLLELEQDYRDSLRLYLEIDPDQLLAKTMKSRPDITLLKVIIAKTEGENMSTIARSLAVNYQSLVRFFNDRRETLYASIQAFHERR